MNVLLTGATGFIGHNAAAALAQAGHQIRPLSRRHGADVRHMLTPEDWLAHLEGIDAVVNCIGIIGEHGTQRFAPLHTLAPMALFRACVRAGIRRVIQISAVGTDETAFSAYHLSKRAADDDLRALDLDWFVLRPSLVYGLGGASTRLFMRLARLPLLPVLGDGQQLLQPVHISDVASAILYALTATESRKTLDIVGSETIIYSEWLQRMRQAQGLPRARLLHIPFSAALLLARMGRHFNPMLQPENLLMLKAGYRADVQPLAHFLGRLPVPFAPHLLFSDVSTHGEQP
jgi:uncharacterized protein YbjT (DUF2867 family)